MTKIPFNIKYRPQIESGEYKVVTREDRPVEIKIWDLKGDFPVVGVFFDEKNNRDTAVQVTAEGRCSIKPNDDYCDDFFIITSKSDLTEFESAVQEIFYKGREDNIDLLKITSSTLLKVARKQLTAELPSWTKTNLPDGIDYSLDEAIFSFKGYSISINELEKLPKED